MPAQAVLPSPLGRPSGLQQLRLHQRALRRRQGAIKVAVTVDGFAQAALQSLALPQGGWREPVGPAYQANAHMHLLEAVLAWEALEPDGPWSTIADEIVSALEPRLGEGKVADYIPELARVEPKQFGIAITTVDGQTFKAGHADTAFSIQSISKVFIISM